MHGARKWLLMLVLGLGLTAFASAAGAANVGQAVIDGKSADRVHLRASASAGAKSLGLYFTGTPVVYESDPGAQWVMVTIGRQSGYMKSEFLYRGTDPNGVTPRQPKGTVSNRGSDWINLREEPSTQAAVAGVSYNGETVTILGETDTGWYYVLAGGQYGYMLAAHVEMGGVVSPTASPAQGYEMLLYTQAPNDSSSIRIQYPKFTGDGFDALNAMIYDKVRSLAQPYSAGPGITIDYQAAVTFQSSKLVSVIFWGMSDVQGSAHPSTNLFALNVDLSSLREIMLEDVYTTDAAFEKVFFEKAYFPTNPVTSYSAAAFLEMLQLQTPAYQGISPFSLPGNVACFFKPDGIVLSMPAVHATGSDHFEAQLRYGDIQQFYRLGQRYWEQ